jgi:putative CocE/NonD family hydrolase
MISLLIFIAMFIVCGMVRAQPPKRIGARISKFGHYKGYSAPVYNEWARTSQYLEMSDGVKLAMDIIRPAENGKPVEKPLPVVWEYYRYHRAREKEGNILSLVDLTPSLQTLIRHGYVIVVVDARGTGASYGTSDKGPQSPEDIRHVYEITEWLASQSWCDGNVGMTGHSYSANIQFRAAAVSPPHLKAVFPAMATFDIYSIFCRGGVFADKAAQGISSALRHWDIESQTVPVDEDTVGVMLAEARKEHEQNVDPYTFLKTYTYRDTDANDLRFWIDNNLVTYVEQTNASGIPVYQWAGWHDFLIADALRWFANLTVPQKLAVGPWAHSSYDWYELLSIEQLRWFDYWLKGIDNGILDEPPLHYVVIEGPDKHTWHSATTWPLPESQNTSFYFHAGKSGSVQSVNDGMLSTAGPAPVEGYDTYVTDYSATSEGEDMTLNDTRGLTYTTLPLENDITLVGHPAITLYIESTADDGDFYAYLEEVDNVGTSRCLTDGLLRASHRALAEPPFDNLELPYHRHFKEDVKSLPENMPATLHFDLLPISRVIKAGNRIRLTITGADKSYTEEGRIDPPPTVTVYRSQQYPSHIVLPIVE